MTTSTSTTSTNTPADRESEAPPHRVLLIDLDNCPNEMAKLGTDLLGFTRIVGCYAGSEPKISLSLVPTLAESIAAGRLNLVQMKPGRNAADFGLAFWAGRLLETLPADTEFLVLSRDKDLDRVVELLQDAGKSATRIVTNGIQKKKTSKIAETETAEAETARGKIAEAYADTCLRSAGGNPKTKKSLRNSIKSFLKGEHISTDPNRIIDSLMDAGLVEFNHGQKPVYFIQGPPFIDHPDDIPF